jgi:hypothetical protein
MYLTIVPWALPRLVSLHSAQFLSDRLPSRTGNRAIFSSAMRYLRFLKPPKLEGSKIKAVLTITTDLGESFYLEDAQIAVHVRRHGANEDLQREILSWRAGMRALPVEIHAKGLTSNKISFYLLAVAEHGEGWKKPSTPAISDVSYDEDELRALIPTVNIASYPIVGVWSDLIASNPTAMKNPRRVERRLRHSSLDSPPLRIWEDTGESIARHIWYVGIISS